MKTYELTNELMEFRARVGLAVWVCRYLHKEHHRRVSRNLDERWGVTTWDCHCTKCKREWIDLTPLWRAYERTLCETLTPAVHKLMDSEDPVYALIKKQQDA